MIDLPTSPAPSNADVGLIDFGAFLTPSLGGPIQRINRMGSRHRMSVSMPPMLSTPLGRQWVSKLVRGKLEGARMPFPLLDFAPGTTGTILVNGASQSGTSLIVDGATANYAFVEGQWFSILTNGKHYLHQVTADTVASGLGAATLPIFPMIRKSPADNSPCHFAVPMIEGFILGEEMAWNYSVERHVGLSFQIVESE